VKTSPYGARFIESDEDLAAMMPFECTTWHGAVARAQRCADVIGARVVVMNADGAVGSLPGRPFAFVVARWDRINQVDRICHVAVPQS
jgi:hypothetical protein